MCNRGRIKSSKMSKVGNVSKKVGIVNQWSTPSYRLFLFVAENRLTYSSCTWNDLQEQK